MPGVLYGQEVIRYKASDELRFQRLENKAYRNILQLPIFTATEFIRGEVGASSFKARDMKAKLNYYRYACYETNNNLLKQFIETEKFEKSKWYKKVYKFM